MGKHEERFYAIILMERRVPRKGFFTLVRDSKTFGSQSEWLEWIKERCGERYNLVWARLFNNDGNVVAVKQDWLREEKGE